MARKLKINEEDLPQLIADSQEGDAEAFGHIYDYFVDSIYRYCAFRTSEQTAEDITADIFLKAWEKLHQYTAKRNVPFRAWLFRIARHTVIDVYRQQQGFAEVPEEIIDPDILNRADAITKAKDLVKLVQKAISQLPKKYREVLELSFLAGLPNEEVSRVLRMTQGGVRVTKFRALKRLEELLPPYAQDLLTI